MMAGEHVSYVVPCTKGFCMQPLISSKAIELGAILFSS